MLSRRLVLHHEEYPRVLGNDAVPTPSDSAPIEKDRVLVVEDAPRLQAGIDSYCVMVMRLHVPHTQRSDPASLAMYSSICV